MQSNKLKCIFTRVQKTASTPISRWLRETDNNIIYYRKQLEMLWLGDPLHVPLYLYERLIPKEIFQEYFKFGFTRNPWEKTVSQYFYCLKWWFHKLDRNAVLTLGDKFHESKMIVSEHELYSFEMYVKNHRRWLYRPSQYNILSDMELLEGCDFIGRYENLDNDWNVVCDNLGVDRFRLPILNVSNVRRPYTEYYTQEIIDIIAETHKRDIDFFGYQYGENVRRL